VARHQSQPKYRIVEDYLRSQIAAGTFPVDTLLPTEEVLRTRFGVSRATVRSALNNLQADGMIARTPAIGSRVLAQTQRKAFQTGWNSVEDLLQYTQAMRLHVNSVREVIVDNALSEEIGFVAGRSVVEVRGVRWNKKETVAPLCLVEIYFDALYSAVNGMIATANRPIADLIEDRYQVRIEHIRQEISAGELTSETAQALAARKGSPALIIKRWYFDGDNQMFQMTQSRYPAERFRYVVEFGRHQRQSVTAKR